MFFCFLSKFYLYPFDFSAPKSSLRATIIWLTLVLVISFLITFICLKQTKKSNFLKKSLTFFTAYACTVAILFLTATFIENAKDGVFITLLFIPTAILTVSLTGCVIIFTYCKNKKIKLGITTFTVLSFIATVICLFIHFIGGEGADLNGLKNSDVKTIPLTLSAITLTAIIIVVAFLTDKQKLAFTTRALTYGGVTVAMSFALSYLKLVKMPQGGSITLASMLPIMLYAYMFGTKKGIIVGAVYGLLQALQDPFIIHPSQFILDYPLAFCCVGLCGIFNNNLRLQKLPRLQFCLGAAISGIARLIIHFLAGVFAFSAFSGDQNPFLYSLIYQVSYILPDVAIVIAVGAIVFSSKYFITITRQRDL